MSRFRLYRPEMDMPETEWPNVVEQIEARHRRRNRATAGLVALVAVASGVGGFAIGNQDSTVHLSPGSDTEGTGRAADTTARPMPDLQATGSSGDTAALTPGFGDMGRPATPLFARDTDAGLALRVTRTELEGAGSAATNQAAAIPAECTTVAFLNIGIVLPDDLAVATGQVTTAKDPMARLVTAYSSTQRPLVVLVVTGVGSKRVSATFPGGTRDSMTAREGIAVLAADVNEAQVGRWRDVKVAIGEGEGAAPLGLVGSEMIGVSGAAGDATSADAPPQLDCSPRLPAPGEQPADPAAAEQAVVDTFTTVYDFTSPADRRGALIDDATGVEAALQNVLAGGFADAARGARFKFGDLVFTDPTTAAVRYDIEIPEGSGAQSVAQNRFGTARLVDGVWKVARATVCADLQLAGGSCDPGSVSDPGFAPTTILEGTGSPR